MIIDTGLGAELRYPDENGSFRGWIISKTLQEGEYRNVQMTFPFVTGQIGPKTFSFDTVVLKYWDAIEDRTRFSVEAINPRVS